MTYQTLYRTYRPQRFADVAGQAHVTRTLQNAVAGDKLAHAYLFCGPRGTGKTTTARILAKALNCRNLPPAPAPEQVEPCNECESCVDIGRGVSFDVYEVDAASHRGIDDIRSISERAQQAATDPSRHSVFIIDEVHQLSRDGASAFLKTLEEPPPNVVFVLATTDPDKMISTILSRCQRFDFRPVATVELAAHLAKVSAAEGIEAEPEALEAIARRSKGGARDALSALEQARALCDDRITVADIGTIFGGIDVADLAGVVDAVIADDAAGALRQIEAVTARGIDVRAFARELTDYVRGVFLAATAPDARDLIGVGDDAWTRMRDHGQALGPGRATRALSLLGQALTKMPQSLNPRIDVETTLVQLTRLDTDSSTAGLLARIEQLERRVSVPAQAPAPSSPPPAAAPSAPAPRTPVPDAVTEVRIPPAAAERATTSEPQPAQPPGEAPEPAAEPSAAPASAAPAPEIDEVERRWPAVLEAIREQSRRVGAYFLDSVPLSVDDDMVCVGFVASFHRDHAADEEGRLAFAEATAAVLGRRLGLQAKVSGEQSGGATAAPTASRTPAPARRAAGPAVTATDAPQRSDDAGDEDIDLSETTSAPPGGGGSAVLDLLTSQLGGEVISENDAR